MRRALLRPKVTVPSKMLNSPVKVLLASRMRFPSPILSKPSTPPSGRSVIVVVRVKSLIVFKPILAFAAKPPVPFWVRLEKISVICALLNPLVAVPMPVPRESVALALTLIFSLVHEALFPL